MIPATGLAAILLVVSILFGGGVYLLSMNSVPGAAGSGPCQANEPILLTVRTSGSSTRACTAKAPYCEAGSQSVTVTDVTSGLRNGTPGNWTLHLDFNPTPVGSVSNKTYDVESGGLKLFLDAGLPFWEKGGWQSSGGSAMLSQTNHYSNNGGWTSDAGTVDVQASGTGSVHTDAHITGSWACNSVPYVMSTRDQHVVRDAHLLPSVQ